MGARDAPLTAIAATASISAVTLLRDIQDAAQDSNVDLADLLRKCKVLAARLKHAEFAQWVTRELNGYENAEDVPAYRRIAVQSIGYFSGPFGSGISNAPIPAALLPEDMRHVATEQPFPQPVSTLAAFSSGHGEMLKGKWSGDLIAYVQQRYPMYEHMVLADAWRVIPDAAIHGILDTIRTRVLDFVLAIEEAEPAAGEAEPGEPARVSKDTVTNVFHTVIQQGGQANIGTAGDAHIRTGAITYSSAVPEEEHAALDSLLDKLRKHLETAPPDDRAEAADTLARVERELATPTPRLERMTNYLKLIAAIVTAAAPTVDLLRELLHRIFG